MSTDFCHTSREPLVMLEIDILPETFVKTKRDITVS